jgi:hypothetical protein
MTRGVASQVYSGRDPSMTDGKRIPSRLQQEIGAGEAGQADPRQGISRSFRNRSKSVKKASSVG